MLDFLRSISFPIASTIIVAEFFKFLLARRVFEPIERSIVKGASSLWRRFWRQSDASSVLNPMRCSDTLPRYFKQQRGTVDVMIYELSLRPNIPIMDLLYMEYLRDRLEKDSIDRVFIFPWSGWRESGEDSREQLFVKNARSVFGAALSKRVTIVTSSDLQANVQAVFDNSFFDQVAKLGNSVFLKRASTLMGYRFRSYHDINQGHPETHQARSIVEHTIRGWLIYKYLEKSNVLKAHSSNRLQVASLVWERELTKLLLLTNLRENHRDEVDCSLVVCSTVGFRKGLKRIPLPTFGENAIEVFGDEREINRVLATKNGRELRVLCSVLRDILYLRDDMLSLSGGSVDAETSLFRRWPAPAVKASELLSVLRDLYV